MHYSSLYARNHQAIKRDSLPRRGWNSSEMCECIINMRRKMIRDHFNLSFESSWLNYQGIHLCSALLPTRSNCKLLIWSFIKYCVLIVSFIIYTYTNAAVNADCIVFIHQFTSPPSISAFIHHRSIHLAILSIIPTAYHSAFIYQPSVTPPCIQIHMWHQVQVFFFQCFHVIFTWIAFWPSRCTWQSWLSASFWSKMHFLFNVICTLHHPAPSMLVPMATNSSVGTNAF